MNFSVSSGALSKQMKAISGVIQGSPMNEILGCVLFEINKNELKISATDMESMLCSTLEITSEISQNIAIDSKYLLELLATFSEQPLTFHILEKNVLEIVAQNISCKTNFFDGDEFPLPIKLNESKKSTLPSNILNRAISKTIFATGKDNLRPAMEGVFFEFTKESLNFVATDGHRLCIFRRLDIKSSEENSFIVPKKPLNLLKRMLSDVEETDISIVYNETNVSFRSRNMILTARLIDATFPNYKIVVPKESPNKLSIDRNILYVSSGRVDLHTNKENHKVSLKMKRGFLEIFAKDVNFSKDYKEKLSCHYQGDDMEIGFNARSLNEMLGNLDTQEIEMELSLPNRAGLIKPIPSEENEDLAMLLMPVNN